VGPDYTRYDEVQLRQAHKSIDAQRFPERVREIESRLAQLASMPAEPAVGKPAVFRPGLPELRRAAVPLFLLALMDVVTAVFRLSDGMSHGFFLNLTWLDAAVAIWSGSLRAASTVRWLGWLTLPPWPIIALVGVAMAPDLTLTQMRLYPLVYVGHMLIECIRFALFCWGLGELGRAPLLAACAAAGRAVRDMRIPLALGCAIAIALACTMVGVLHGERAMHAEKMAAEKFGTAYRYNTDYVSVFKGTGGTTVSALVVAWNDKEIVTFPVSWKE